MRFGSYHSPVFIALVFIAGLVTSLSLVVTVTNGRQGIPSATSIDPFVLMQTASQLIEQKIEGDLM